MDIDYHINLVKNPSSGYKRTVSDSIIIANAIKLYPRARAALTDFVITGDHFSFIKEIEEYDKFVWEQSHKPDKSNLFAYKKIKISPTWTEQIWAPVFDRIKKVMENFWGEKLVLIQNTEVLESLSIKGPSAFKDVDGGIGIIKEFRGFRKQVIMPIVVTENKTGHFCKTACTGVDGIIRRVRTMNPNVLAFGITDNNISVSKTAEVDHVFGSGGILIQQRGVGLNGKRTYYPKLDYIKFQLVENLCINYLKTKKVSDFINIEGKETSGVKLRESIDSKGVFIPPDLVKFT